MNYPLRHSRSLRPTGCWAALVLTGIVLLGLNQPLPAQTITPVAEGPQPVIAESGDEAVTKPVGPPSVVLELNDAGMDYKKQLDATNNAYRAVTVPIEKLTALQTAEKKFRDNPDDSQAAANFADAFSDALVAFDDRLRKFLSSQAALEKFYASFVASMKAAIEAVQKEREHHQKLEADSDQLAQAIEKELDQLTIENRETIDKGEPLPREIDKKVVKLTNSFEHIQNAKRLSADHVKRATSNLKELQRSLASGELKMEKNALRFERAEGDVSLIALIAAAKAQELAPKPVIFDDDEEEEEEFRPNLKPFLILGSDIKDQEAPETKPSTETLNLGGANLLRARLKSKANATVKAGEQMK